MRVERSVSSGDKRAGAKMMTPITDSRNGSSSIRHGKSPDEVDAVRNPTELFRRINSGNWEKALDAVQSNPAEASVWISRRNSADDGLAWKYLPLHLICLQQRPPLELLLALLQFYPQAASLSTPHDGNLPIHYVCESGCEDEHVFGALLASFPQSLEVKNTKEKTPLLMCHAKSRGIMMKVLRQRKPLPFNDGQNRRDKSRKSRRRGADRPNDTDTSWKETSSREQRQPSNLRPPQTPPAGLVKNRPFKFADTDEPNGREDSAERRNNTDTSQKETPSRERRPPSNLRPRQTTPARLGKNQRSKFVDTDEPSSREDTTKTPKSDNYRRSSKKKAMEKDPASFFTTSLSSGSEDNDTAAFISSKTTELGQRALSALTYLYPSYQGEPEEEKRDDPLNDQVCSLTTENAAQQRTIEELTKKLDRQTSSNETNTDNSKLCERILAKAEADNVAFRTQLQKLQDEKDEMKKAADLTERANKKCLDQMRKMLSEKGSEMKIDVFGDASSHSSGSEDKDQITEALQTVLSHMDERNNNLHSTIGRLETDVSKSEVALKIIQSKNHILQGEKDSMAKRHRELERKATILEEEKGMVQTGLGDLKDRVSTLTVINQSLQEQVDSMSNSQVKQENEQFQSELNRLNAQLVQMKEEKDKTDQLQFDHQQAVEMEEKIESLLEKNRSLKDTILLNNEKYSKKVQELGEKYSSLEKANKDLRQSLAKMPSGSGAQSDVRLHLCEDEHKLLYEV